ncbi:methionine ABC transporter ATP-binding protein [Wolinella succinogenes]|uniref:Methionine import ATP-binding protein MetN n=1 Tax=Wolinella succinogenes (strain ATCC 29543 / DSM 1740 / CCUG 13145 / JCM 31913 / LMG 7466 / NCTC 11488 / FDC 602W) TaxID=273121 RepID=METN_WOLSU|nr:methionine ABC transporter ATP-binding protein [Wolinella succinogenes]Q7M816.1 RecName: Full=Methionine import ATP-binding protein MetN [Wolinella succinogenes DSM 1740]CAE10949.1 ABC TRANSPORT ATP-BINDING PROTEIN [Wolinella succinogenes]VEG81110.1 Methionine import ATP-binding protein MetN [Wolinella succinogenes]HCZ19556.1 methionine ABC transporter ATP-binding protein [Helicobacter sp.]
MLDQISLEIPKGTIYGLVGHSGAGKSTLLRTINGLEGFDEGELWVDGVDLQSLQGDALRVFRKNIGMIFQHFSLMARQNVFENVALPLRCWKYPEAEIQKRVFNLLSLVGLESKSDSYPSALSGGQKQRVAIARALTLEPQILLSDEATSALDPSMTQSILDLLQTINQELGVTVVLVTHEMEVVKKLCHHAAFLEGGKLLRSGNIEELFLQPDPKMRHFLGESEVLPKEGVNIRLYFPKEVAQNPIITQMARQLSLDFSIVWGKLERFGEDVLGSLVINIPEARQEEAERFLESSGVRWEVL